MSMLNSIQIWSENLLGFFVVPVMAVHLIAVNLACAGPLLASWLHFRSRESETLARLGRSLAWASLIGLGLGMLTGGVLLFVPPATGLQEAIRRIPAQAYWMAGTELIFSAVCMLICAGCWKPLQRWRWLHASISLLGATNLLYHFPPLMAVLGKLAADPTWSTEPMIDRPLFLGLMYRGEIVSLATHFGLASFVVAAVVLLVMIARAGEEDRDLAVQSIARKSAIIALVGSLLQVPVGVWILGALSNAEREVLMGGELLASLVFLGGMLLTFLLLQRLAAIALGEFDLQAMRQTGWLLLVLVLLMTATLRSSRQAGDSKRTAAEARPPRLISVQVSKCC